MNISKEREHNLVRIPGKAISVDPNVEPLVQPDEGGWIEMWNLEAYGTVLGSPAEPAYHIIRQFPRKEDAVLLHDMLMGGKISWRQAARTIIQRD